MNFIAHYRSPLGMITFYSRGESLAGLWFDGQKYDRSLLKAGEETEETPVEKELPVFSETRKWLDIYFSGKRPDFTPALEFTGSNFRKLVSEILLEIPFGEVRTYGEIAGRAAERLGREKMSAQAAGGAVGHNPISIIVPCHRVVGADGSLTGYAGGVEKKLALLKNEGIDPEKRGLYVPVKGTAL